MKRAFIGTYQPAEVIHKRRAASHLCAAALLGSLFEALAAFFAATGRSISFEYGNYFLNISAMP